MVSTHQITEPIDTGFLDDGQLLRDASRLSGIPILVAHGRRDISGPADIAVMLAGAVDGVELFLAEEEGHGGLAMTDWTVTVTDRLAAGSS